MRVRKTRNSTNITPQIWNEAGFRDLTHTAQWLFLTIGTLPELDWSGCLDYNPYKLAALNTDLTSDDIEAAAQELHKHGWVLLDPGTQEIYLRGYQTMGTHLRHANMGKALAAALDLVYSAPFGVKSSQNSTPSKPKKPTTPHSKSPKYNNSSQATCKKRGKIPASKPAKQQTGVVWDN